MQERCGIQTGKFEIADLKNSNPNNHALKRLVMSKMSEAERELIKDASKRLTGFKRRQYQASITLKYFDGNARKAERVLGWGRKSLEKGLGEARTGIRCLDNYKNRGRKRTEDRIEGLKEDVCEIAELHTQADPAVKSSLTYTRLTGESLKKGLVEDKGYAEEQLPSGNTFRSMLNRLGYNRKRVQKAKPLKKIKQVDEIFDNVHEANRESDENPKSLRLSMDAKAKMKLGPFSRGGKSRDREAKKAADHDMNPEAKLVPYGILDVLSGLLTIFFGTSNETSDFIVDCLETWWEMNASLYPNIEELVINLDNGPNNASGRTQFIRRMVEFSEKTGLRIRLLYYPPYHSKYNPVERCWGVLEEHWNGEILDSVSKVLEWAATMTWKGVEPVVRFVERIYEKGVKLTKKEMEKYEDKINRSKSLPKWDVVIEAL
jgi:hypothetical protein